MSEIKEYIGRFDVQWWDSASNNNKVLRFEQKLFITEILTLINAFHPRCLYLVHSYFLEVLLLNISD